MNDFHCLVGVFDVDEDGNLDDEALERACEAMAREYKEDMDESEW